MKKLFVIFAFTGLSLCTNAQDTIRFTWEAGTELKKFTIGATLGTQFTIDWGDNSGIETKTAGETWSPDGTDMFFHSYTTDSNYTVTITGITEDCCFRILKLGSGIISGDTNYKLVNLDVSACPALQILYCYNSLLTDLNLSTNIVLEVLGCPGNKIYSLNLGNNTALRYLDCQNNRLSLSDLFTASEKISEQYNKWLGTQILDTQTVSIGTALFSKQSVFNGVYTDYTVMKNGILAPTNDYTVTDGKITFNTIGNYTVTMTNLAIFSDKNFPAKVIVEINVNEVGIAETVQKTSKISIYPNPTNGQLKIMNYELKENTVIEIFDVVGRKYDSHFTFHNSHFTFHDRYFPLGKRHVFFESR
jgi:hypothetical protein